MSEPTIDPLDAYLQANRSRYTEDALRAAAIAAGNDPAKVDEALVRTRELAIPPTIDRGRLGRNIFLAYLGVYVVLAALIFVNPANEDTGGFLGDVRGIGIFVLSMALGGGVIASLVWIASRRLFWAALGMAVAVYALAILVNPYSGAPIYGAALLVIGIGLVVGAARVGIRPGVPAMPTMGLLLSLPLLILVAVGGICVVSGLPIPRSI